MEIIKILLVLILTVIIVLCVLLMYLHYAKRMSDLEKRVTDMEQANQKRMPHNVTRGIEDIELELIAMMSQHELVSERSQAMLSLLQRLHRDGAKYDANKSFKEINEEMKLKNL